MSTVHTSTQIWAPLWILMYWGTSSMEGGLSTRRLVPSKYTMVNRSARAVPPASSSDMPTTSVVDAPPGEHATGEGVLDLSHVRHQVGPFDELGRGHAPGYQ